MIEQFDLEPVILTLSDTASRYNCLQSAVFEMIDYITINSMRDIGMHIWDEYSERLESYECFRKSDLFNKLKDEYIKRKKAGQNFRANRASYTQSTSMDRG